MKCNMMNTILSYNSLNEFIHDELDRRKMINPTYSLRAFARDLQVAPSTLSEILNGKYGVSNKLINKFVSTLGLNREEADYLQLLTFRDNPWKQRRREETIRKIEKFKHLKQRVFLEKYQIIGQWYYVAILELTWLNDFRSDYLWIGQKLGLSPSVVERAVKKLLDLKLLVEREGRWVASYEFFATENDIPSRALKEAHRQLLGMAERSLSEDEVDEREFQFLNLPYQREAMPEVKEFIRNFVQEFCEKFAVKECGNEVGSLTIQFFNITKGEKL